MSYIKRAIEPVIQKRLKEAKALLLTGARQVGKSTLLTHAFSEYERVSFDDRRERMAVRDDPGMFFLNHPGRLFIDEVQKEPSVFEELKLRMDRSSDRGQYLLSGSQGLELMKDISESLSGRVSVSRLSGLSLREIMGISFNESFIPTEDYIAGREGELCDHMDIWRLIHRGSYPELYDIDRDWQDFYSSYVNTYIERDINEMVSADSLTFMKFMTAVAARTGQILVYSNIASDVGVSEPTIKKWISILERTGIVYIIKSYAADVLKRAIRAPKVYFCDTGLACYLTRWLTPDTIKNSAVAGNMFETFVVSEIMKSYYNAGVDPDFSISYYRGRDKRSTGDNEIDLVIEQDGVVYPVEIKLTTAPRADMAAAYSALDKLQGKKRGMGVILCMVEKKTYLRENLLALPISYI